MKIVILLYAMVAFGLPFPSFADALSEQSPQRVKIEVNTRGVFKLTYNMLQESGLVVSEIDPRTINITNKGEAIPIFVKGEEDGSLDPDDYIEFFGTFNEGKTTTKDRYSDINAYMLSWGNETPVRLTYEEADEVALKNLLSQFADRSLDDVMESLLGNSEPETEMEIETEEIGVYHKTSFRRTIHFEEDKITNWRFAHPGGEETDFAFWWWLDSTRANPKGKFDLPGLVTGTTVSLKMKLYGITHLDIKPDHHIVLFINEQKISDIWWDGAVEYLLTIDQLPTRIGGRPLIREEGNKIRIEIPGDIGQGHDIPEKTEVFDQVFMDWFEIEYTTEGYVPEGFLEVKAVPLSEESSPWFVQFDDLDSDQVEIFELSDGRIIKPITESPTGTTSKTLYSAYFLDTPDYTKHYVVTTEERKKRPQSLSVINLRGLASPDNTADLIIITHRDFRTASDKLASWKIEKGLSTIVVDIDEVYNEFNYGIKHPDAIRNFLQYAYNNWQSPKPRYALLIGDALWHINNLNEDGEQTHSFIPTFYFQPKRHYLEYATDNWFVSFGESESDSPEMAIGRFPVETIDQAMSIVDKTIEYEQNNTSGEWQKRCLIMTSQEQRFKNDGRALPKSYFPSDFIPTFVFKNKTKSPTEVIVDSFNNGTPFAVFLGHGGADLWGGTSFFVVKDIERLSNKGMYPICVIATCFSGNFDTESDKLNLGEELLRVPNGGAVAVLGTGWRSVYHDDFLFTKEFLDHIFQKGYRVLGDAFVDAKRALQSPDVSHGFVILGDPSLEIQIPTP